MPIVRTRPSVELVFRTDHGAGGSLQPLIGVMRTEDEVERVRGAHPDRGIVSETMTLHAAPASGTAALDRVWLLIEGGVFHESSRWSPSPVRAFASREAATRWQRSRTARGATLIVVEAPFGTVNIDAPDWRVL